MFQRYFFKKLTNFLYKIKNQKLVYLFEIKFIINKSELIAQNLTTSQTEIYSMSNMCIDHKDYEYLFVNLREIKGKPRLLCEICVQEQSETHELSLVSIGTLISNSFSQHQKLIQFADQEKILLPYIKFDIVQNGTLEKINSFYDELSSSLLQFVEAKREETLKNYYGLIEAQTKIRTISKLEEIQNILRNANHQGTQTLLNQVKEYFDSQKSRQNEIKSYLECCVSMSNKLEGFQSIQDKVSEIKEKIDGVLRSEDELSYLSELSQKEIKKVEILKEQIKSQTSQLQKLINFNTNLKYQKPIENFTKPEIDLYKLDALNKSKNPNCFMLKIAEAIKNSKFFIPLEMKQEANSLIFSRTQPGDNLIGLIDAPIDDDVFGQPFKVKVLQGYVSIGICARDIHVKRCYRYEVQSYQPSCGYAMLSTSGFSYSSFSPSQHKQYIRTHYGKDTILTVIPCDNKVVFKSQCFETQELPFSPQEDIVYTPCFMLSEESSIQFIVEE
ncbi:hypothetical protein TTHERM_00784470 (macronuclear) [Tetrahymena thermophila SB210]|uniref:Uncharacterized protein n=1 Tax=Tetrahymena thermophila (strain SB210) TaxID=312017 RepID=Q231P2_TETTS|nr:hypothetical protein TTHERM_00784470 [Tetrahymena thermophila SB210]EAR91260.3 hypothetical protein TTHERM_00784470 [Tetrahymena thermophila SB210]|eukprot:XP_001011505.3 hypothetical protein TTHERM_00784470 [Tetrahymena thermophila SB210]